MTDGGSEEIVLAPDVDDHMFTGDQPGRRFDWGVVIMSLVPLTEECMHALILVGNLVSYAMLCYAMLCYATQCYRAMQYALRGGRDDQWCI